MDQLPFISSEFMELNTNFKQLIATLEKGFATKGVETPMRHHHDYKNPEEGIDSTLLLMPSWEAGNDLGVKIVSVSPNNGKYDLPSIQGTYIYMDAHKGIIKAMLDAKALTAKRTAAASALAASYLAKKEASSMLMLGTGALASNLIKAHASIRPLKKVYVWGRSFEKANMIARQFDQKHFEVIAIKNYMMTLPKVDIISCATLSKEPLVFGKLLQPGQHLDLVGAYKKDMREADDAAVLRSKVFLDTFQGGLKESGDIVIPIQRGIIKESDIEADLFGLCSGIHPGRQDDQEITFFKSVGHASEDLMGARYYFSQWKNEKASTGVK